MGRFPKGYVWDEVTGEYVVKPTADATECGRKRGFITPPPPRPPSAQSEKDKTSGSPARKKDKQDPVEQLAFLDARHAELEEAEQRTMTTLAHKRELLRWASRNERRNKAIASTRHTYGSKRTPHNSHQNYKKSKILICF